MNDKHRELVHNHSISLFQEMEKILDCPLVSYTGEIVPVLPPYLKQALEKAKETNSENKKIAILLKTTGGSVEGAERMVNAIRHLFQDVIFIIDQYAMSAGTMVALSGNEILMHYTATLGPIDPQVLNEKGVYTPASAYIHKIEEWIKKSENGAILSQAEIILLNKTIDAGTLSGYESAIELGVSLVEKWLATYKFQTWKKSRTEKQKRARKIARDLSNFKKWHTHGRPLNIDYLRDLQLQIIDYTDGEKYKNLDNLITEYRKTITVSNDSVFVHSKDII